MNINNRHIRDDDIKFESHSHKYTILDGTKSYVSVTSFVKTFFPVFNPESAIIKMKKSKNWNESNKYFNMTDDEIKTLWVNIGTEASAAGTGLHETIDKYLNSILETEPDSIEWNMFRQFIDNFESKGIISEKYRSEWMIYDEESQICGTLDFIYKNTDDTYTIVDWKRSKNISEPRSLFINNSNYWIYTLQLNLYKYILEKNYGLKVSKLMIVQLHPENETYKIFSVPDKQYTIKGFVRDRRKKLLSK